MRIFLLSCFLPCYTQNHFFFFLFFSKFLKPLRLNQSSVSWTTDTARRFRTSGISDSPSIWGRKASNSDNPPRKQAPTRTSRTISLPLHLPPLPLWWRVRMARRETSRAATRINRCYRNSRSVSLLIPSRLARERFLPCRECRRSGIRWRGRASDLSFLLRGSEESWGPGVRELASDAADSDLGTKRLENCCDAGILSLTETKSTKC